MKQRERITRGDLGREDDVGDTILTPRPNPRFRSDAKKPAGNAQVAKPKDAK